MIGVMPQTPLPSQPVIVFDGVCNMCNALAQFILKRDRRRQFLLCASQSDAGVALLSRFDVRQRSPDAADSGGPSGPDTIFLVEDGQLHLRSTAALRIARRLGFPWRLAYAFIVVPRVIRDGVYN